MTSREIETLLLNEVAEFYDGKIQLLLYRDMNKINGNLKIPRVMTRTVASDVLRSYESEEISGDNIVAKQYNIVNHTVYINFVGINQEEVSRIRSYFNHKRGFTWFVQQKGLSLVRMNVSEIRDITDNQAKGMLECWQFEMDLKTHEECNIEIPYVKDIDFEVIAK